MMIWMMIKINIFIGYPLVYIIHTQ